MTYEAHKDVAWRILATAGGWRIAAANMDQQIRTFSWQISTNLLVL
jgi:hypothetical protein